MRTACAKYALDLAAGLVFTGEGRRGQRQKLEGLAEEVEGTARYRWQSGQWGSRNPGGRASSSPEQHTMRTLACTVA
eukprot:scaffold1085_cov407-Prasinococcus_capsulatus_cf.AAC.60